MKKTRLLTPGTRTLNTKTNDPKETNLHLRMSKHHKSLLVQAAKLRNTTITQLFLDEVMREALDIVTNEAYRHLEGDKWERFCKTLKKPEERKAFLKKLLNDPSLMEE